jgi:hypothetical protein
MDYKFFDGEKLMEQTILRIQQQGTNTIAAEYAAGYIKLHDKMRETYILPETMIGMRKYAEQFIGWVKQEKMANDLQAAIERCKLHGYDPDEICRALRGFRVTAPTGDKR